LRGKSCREKKKEGENWRWGQVKNLLTTRNARKPDSRCRQRRPERGARRRRGDRKGIIRERVKNNRKGQVLGKGGKGRSALIGSEKRSCRGDSVFRPPWVPTVQGGGNRPGEKLSRYHSRRTGGERDRSFETVREKCFTVQDSPPVKRKNSGQTWRKEGSIQNRLRIGLEYQRGKSRKKEVQNVLIMVLKKEGKIKSTGDQKGRKIREPSLK